MILCVIEKFRFIVFAHWAKNDKSKLGVQMIRHSEFSENTKLLLSPVFDMTYTNLVYM